MNDIKRLFKKAIGESQYGIDGLLAFIFAMVVAVIATVCLALQCVSDDVAQKSVKLPVWFGVVLAFIPLLIIALFF